MVQRTALIIGASGLVGGHCLQFLLEVPQYHKIIALLRKPLAFTHPKLTQILIDFDHLERYESVIKADDIFCAIGTTVLKSPKRDDYYRIDYTYPFEIAKIASNNGAQNFALVSALTANPNALLFYSRVKGKLEQSILSLPYQGVYIFRPSYLMGERAEFRPIEKIGTGILKLVQPILVGPLRKFRPILAKAVAFGMVNKTIEGKKGGFIFLNDEIQVIYDKNYL